MIQTVVFAAAHKVGEVFDVNWFSGEALFAYSWAVIFVFLAWLMYRNISIVPDRRK